MWLENLSNFVKDNCWSKLKKNKFGEISSRESPKKHTSGLSKRKERQDTMKLGIEIEENPNGRFLWQVNSLLKCKESMDIVIGVPHSSDMVAQLSMKSEKVSPKFPKSNRRIIFNVFSGKVAPLSPWVLFSDTSCTQSFKMLRANSASVDSPTEFLEEMKIFVSNSKFKRNRRVSKRRFLR